MNIAEWSTAECVLFGGFVGLVLIAAYEWWRSRR